ncbi:hypothetical protein AVEN_155338-1 [Araneus ventricosus]|uniref:Uncharacterized protein n=1 Tax=Araneus ventricosus TaxID=182803 RepID=A0A4Y2MQC8_ARAVE|nr:hypothetical protein AVEN_155338-1 [Araneus ventricosus]
MRPIVMNFHCMERHGITCLNGWVENGMARSATTPFAWSGVIVNARFDKNKILFFISSKRGCFWIKERQKFQTFRPEPVPSTWFSAFVCFIDATVSHRKEIGCLRQIFTVK